LGGSRNARSTDNESINQAAAHELSSTRTRGSLTAISPPGATPRTGGLGRRGRCVEIRTERRRARTAQCRGSRRFWIRRGLGRAGAEDSRRLEIRWGSRKRSLDAAATREMGGDFERRTMRFVQPRIF